MLSPNNDRFCRCKSNVFSCLSSVLSKILCSKTHISHSLKKNSQPNLFETSNATEFDGSDTPNVTLRPVWLNFTQEVDPLSPQRHRNLVHYIEETEEKQGKNRAKTAFSFRETTDFIELEDDDFLVLTFDQKPDITKNKKNKRGSRSRHSKVDGKRNKLKKKQSKNRGKQRKEKNIVFSYEDRLRLKISAHSCEIFDDTRIRERKICSLNEECCRNGKKRMDDENECDSDDSSPISVLDHREFVTDVESTIAEEDTRPRPDNDLHITREDIPLGYGPSNGMEPNKEHKQRKVWLKRRDCIHGKHQNPQILSRICKLTEIDVHKDEWKYKEIFTTSPQDLEYVNPISLMIFDRLLNELVNMLSRSKFE